MDNGFGYGPGICWGGDGQCVGGNTGNNLFHALRGVWNQILRDTAYMFYCLVTSGFEASDVAMI
jgi:hypothetical protein